MNPIDIENLIVKSTSIYIENKDREIQKMNSFQKLILWMAGMSIGLQVFLFNMVSYSATNGFTTFLFILTVICFVYISSLSFYINKTIHLVNDIENSNIQKLNYQKLILESCLLHNTKLSKNLVKDFESGELILNIGTGKYLKEEDGQIKSAVSFLKKLNGIGERYISGVLILQFISVAILLFIH